MKTFTDNTGRTWTLSVTVGTIKRVRALCGVDLANIITMESGKTPNVGLLERLACWTRSSIFSPRRSERCSGRSSTRAAASRREASRR